MELYNQVVLITGSAQGLGRAFAVRLLTAGARVAISDINTENGEKTLSELRERFGQDKVCFVRCDVTDEVEFRNLFDKTEEFFKVDCVDILVNNAGINTNWGWKKCMQVNIMAVMTGNEIAMERMKKTGKRGQVINTASMAGLAPGFGEDMIGYTVSKHGVVALTRTMAADPRLTAVQHKCICPSWTDTEIVSSVNTHKEEIDKHINSMGGLMTVENVAEGFYRLVTECGTGTALAVTANTPFLIVPDYSVFPAITSLVIMARLVRRVTGAELVTRNHLIVGFILVALLFLQLITWIF